MRTTGKAMLSSTLADGADVLCLPALASFLGYLPIPYWHKFTSSLTETSRDACSLLTHNTCLLSRRFQEEQDAMSCVTQLAVDMLHAPATFAIQYWLTQKHNKKS